MNQMPLLYLVRHGPRGTAGSRTDAGKELTFKEYDDAFGDYEVGPFFERGPVINPESPSRYYKSVVVEVREGEEGQHEKLSKQGFYLINDLTPKVAYRLMHWSG